VIFVVDDDPSVRDALEDLLSTAGLEVRTFASTQEFLQSTKPDTPGCLVLDLKMPGMSGLDFQRELIEAKSPLPIIFITGHGDVATSVQAMKAGAIEFLTKPFLDRDLLDAIQRGLEIDRERRRATAAVQELRERFGALTERQREIMALVVSGRANKQIAAELDLSEITVKVHRGRVMRQMQATSLAELVRMADKLGISAGKPQGAKNPNRYTWV
jgi:FixJ family two-component response regulator